MFFLKKKKKRERKRDFVSNLRGEILILKILSSLKWWSLNHQQWPQKYQTSYLCIKEGTQKWSKFIMIWSFYFSLCLLFLHSCTCTYPYWWERQREGENIEERNENLEKSSLGKKLSSDLRVVVWKFEQDIKMCG